MDIKELVTKKVEELTEEQKAFMKEHAAELTEEQKTAYATVIAPAAAAETEAEKTAREGKEKEAANIAAGLNADGSPKVNASEKAGMTQISASELSALRAKADEGAQAFKELHAAKMTAAVNGLLFSETNKSGKFLPKSSDNLRAFMETLNEAQTAKFAGLMGELPSVELFGEKGSAFDAAAGSAQKELDVKVEAKMKAEPKMKYSEALKAVLSESEAKGEKLEQRFDAELKPAKKVSA